MNPATLSRIQDLGDLGLAPILCMTAEQHGIVLTSADELDNVAREIAMICNTTLNLSVVVLECAHGTDLDHFRESILVPSTDNDDSDSSQDTRHFSPLSPPALGDRHLTSHDVSLDDRRVADVVIAKNLDLATLHVQIQALELLRNGRIYTKSALHLTGHRFLLLAVVDAAGPVGGMNEHLNDAFAISHLHVVGDDVESLRSRSSHSVGMYSVIRGKGGLLSRTQSVEDGGPMDDEVLLQLRGAMEKVSLTPEVSAYIQNVVVALRLHRYVAGGISALATRHLRTVAKGIAVLHGLEYVTPAVVGLAVRKVYFHRLVLADEHTERSIRWGGDPGAVQMAMKGVDVDMAIDAVLAGVQSPL